MRRGRIAGGLLAALLLVAPVAARGSEMVGIGADPAHTGVVTDPSIQPPYSVRWDRSLGTGKQPERSGMVVAGGVVAFIEHTDPSGLSLQVLGQTDGHTLWSADTAPGEDYASVAYAAGVLFFGESGGRVRAYDARTGALKWTYSPSPNESVSPVTAGGGLVLDSGGAIDAATGSLRFSLAWPQELFDSPALAANTIFLAEGTSFASAVNAGTGVATWTVGRSGYDGGATTPTVAGGRVFAYGTDSAALDATSGAKLYDFHTSTMVAVSGGTLLTRSGWDLDAFSAADGTPRWTHPLSPASSPTGELPSAPLVVGGLAYIKTPGGTVQAVDIATGTTVAEWPAAGDTAELGAGDGILVVPHGNSVTAYQPVATPSASPTAPATATAPPAAGTPTPGPTGAPATVTATPTASSTAGPSPAPLSPIACARRVGATAGAHA